MLQASGTVPALPFNFWTVGRGAEIMLGATMSKFGEFRRVQQIGGGIGSLNQITFGLNFHL